MHLILETMSYSIPSTQFFVKGFFYNIPYLTGAFRLETFSTSSNLHHAVWLIFLIYLCLAISSLLFTLGKIIRNKCLDKKASKAIALFYLLHSRIFFFPIQYFLFNVMSLNRTNDPETRTNFYMRPGWMIATIALMGINNLLAILKEFMLYRVNKTKNCSDVKTNIYHQIIIVYKSIALFLAYKSQNGTEAVISTSSILHLLTAVVFFRILYTKLPFYNFQILKLNVIITSMMLCFSLTSVITAFTKNAEVLGGMQLIFSLLPLLGIKIGLSQFRLLFGKIIKGQCKSPEHAIHYSLLMETFVSNNYNPAPEDKDFLPNFHIFYGILHENGFNLEYFDNKRNEKEYQAQLCHHIIQELNIALLKYPNSQLLLVFMAEFYLEKLDNIPNVLELLKKLEGFYLSPPMKSSLTYLQLQLENIYAQGIFRSEAKLQLSLYFKNYRIITYLKGCMISETKKHLEFWDNVQKGNLNVKATLDLAQEIDQLYDISQKTFNENLNNFSTGFTSSLLLYAVYLNNVRYSKLDATKILNRFQKLSFNNQLSNKFDFTSGTTAVVIISLDKVKAGQILDVSGSIESLFDLCKTQLIGKSIGSLFPTIIAKQYQNYIHEYSMSPKYKLEYKENTYGKTAQGEIFELEAEFQLYPDVNKEITIMLLLKKLSSPLPLLIANHDGMIIECSNCLRINLQRESINIDQVRSIQNLILNFETINNVFNQVYGQERKAIKHETSQVTQENSSKLYLINEGFTTRNLLQLEETILESSRNFRSATATEIITYKSNNFLHRFFNEELAQKALKICERLRKGKKEVLCANNMSLSERKNKINGEVQVRPFVIDKEVYKIVIIKNIKKKSLRSSEIKEEIQADDDISTLNFADEFPETNENNNNEEYMKVARKSFKKSFLLNATTEGLSPKDDDYSTSSNRNEENNQQQFKDIIHIKVNNDDKQSSIMNSNHKESVVITTLKRLTTNKRPHRTFYWLKLGIMLFATIIISLSIIKFFQAKESIKNIEHSVNILTLATLRLQAAVNTWLWSLILATGAFPPDGIISLLHSEVLKLSNYNKQLQIQYSLITRQSTVRMAFEENVVLRTMSLDGKDVFEIKNTFTASDFLVEKYLSLTKITESSQLIFFTDLQYTFNNTANDYFISSENLITQTINLLPSIVINGLKNLTIILTIKFLSIAILASSFIAIVVDLSRGYQRICRALTRTQDKLITSYISQLQKTKTLFENDIERKLFVEESYNLIYEEKSKEQTPVQPNSHSHNKVYDMKTFNKHLAKIVLSVIFFLIIFIAYFCLTTVQLKKSANNLEVFTDQISLLSNGCYESSMLVSTIVYENIFSRIPNMLVRNQIPSVQVNQTLSGFTHLNADLASMFLINPSTAVDPLVQNVLQNDICGNLDHDLKDLKLHCLNATGFKKMGLLQLNTEYYMILNYMKTSIDASANFATVMEIFSDKLSQVIGLVFTLVKIYPDLISRVLVYFSEQIDLAEEVELITGLIVCFAVVLFIFFALLKPVKDLEKVDLGRRKILKVLPFQMIQENKALKFYLIQDFKKEIENVKNIL